MNKRTKQLQKGITLIALVITIIVLLILAGVSIATLTGDNGILTNASRAKTETKRQAAKEKVEMAVLASYDKKENLDKELLKANLNNLEGISEKLTEITESNLNSGLKIWVDGYEITINSDGTVKAEGEYVAEKNPPKKPGSSDTEEKEISKGETTNHTADTITYSWEEIDSIAKVISNNSDTIKNDTEEVHVKVNGKSYTLGVGDTKVVDGKTVRILGFNHDELAETEKGVYGGDNTYAGISFEYVDCLTSAKMHIIANNSVGWVYCDLRDALSTTILNDISIKNHIKRVKKEYIITYNNNPTATCDDKLWLLSCGEIWDNGLFTSGGKGYAITTEGNRYRYYSKSLESAHYASGSVSTTKFLDAKNCAWWLRSPAYSDYDCFSCVYANGSGSLNYATNEYGVAPGFAI